MKVKVLSLAVISMFVLSACGGGSNSVLESKVDYRMLENQEATKKVFDEIVSKLGEQAKVADEVEIHLSRPSVEGTIKRPGNPDELNITLDTQHPENKARIQRINYWSNSGGWQNPEQMEVSVMGGDVENFKLEDSLFDFNQIKFEVLFKVISDAYAKYKDTEKYEYQYISNVSIEQGEIEVKIYGKLASNEQEKSNYYKTDFEGKEMK